MYLLEIMYFPFYGNNHFQIEAMNRDKKKSEKYHHLIPKKIKNKMYMIQIRLFIMYDVSIGCIYLA